MSIYRAPPRAVEVFAMALLLRTTLLMLALGLAAGLPGPARAGDYVLFETGPVRPMALSSDGGELYITNIPDNTLEIFAVSDIGLVKTASVPVGLEPCAVAIAPDGKAWVVNHLSDSISIVDVAASPPVVERTLLVGDEPRDIVFAGTGGTRAFISTAHRGQHRTDASIAGVPGAGDPQFTTEGIGRADVWVFDSTTLGATLGGTPVEILSFFADTPRALTVSNDGNTVYVAAFHSGNQSAPVPELAVCDGFDAFTPCLLGGGLPVPGGVPGPDDNVFGANAPETGIIVQFNNSSGNWEDTLGRNWSPVIQFNLPDHDVFGVNANTLNVAGATEFDHVGTILFNMAVNPVNGNVYVSNTELPNLTMFEGPGNHGGSTVQGHLSESRISILSGAGIVKPRHLNKHIDYTRLHTDVPDLVDPTQKDHSLATPLEMVVSDDGAKLYVAAFGSSKIGVFDTATLEDDTFDPTVESANYISTGGGPSGLVLDPFRNWLYVHTRFDNSVSVINPASKETLLTVPLHNPEDATIVDGRRFLYDAFLTSGNGEASCSSCHIFGDMDDLAWNLGNPDDPTTTNTQPSPVGTGGTSFHPMKGPMTTQTLRGLATHGALHWRGDRVDGHFGTDPCNDPTGSACDEKFSFDNFIVAFEGLIGHDGLISMPDMRRFTDFALLLLPPPNPVRNLDNSLTPQQQVGMTAYLKPNTDGPVSCELCHRLDPSQGFFGTGGGKNDEGEPQDFKIPHLRNMYAKIGMFGMLANPDGTVEGFKGDQIRGYGFLHDGIIDTLVHFVEGTAFNLNNAEEDALEQLMLAFPTDLAPIVGQQITLDALNGATVGPRIDLLIARAGASFDSLTLGGTVTECDLVVKGTFGGAPRGWVYDPGTLLFQDDQGGSITDANLRALATSQGPLTYTCATPGAGTRVGINRDRDIHLDGQDNCPDAANDLQTNTDGDSQGDACDADDDQDGLLDFYETGTGAFVSQWNTGSNSLLADTDGDGFDDGVEVAQGSDPNDPNSTPAPPVPLLPVAGLLALCASLGAVAMRRIRRLPGARA